jgi:hypothetical protein
MDGCVWDEENQNSVFPQGLLLIKACILCASVFQLFWSDQYVTIVLCTATLSGLVNNFKFFEQYDLSIGFCIMPINMGRHKTTYILSTVTSSHFLVLKQKVEGLSLFEISCRAYLSFSSNNELHKNYIKNSFKCTHDIQFNGVELGTIHITKCFS